jgi:hypothetical protein
MVIQNISSIVQAISAVAIVCLTWKLAFSTQLYVEYTKKLININQSLLDTNQALVLAQDRPYVAVALKKNGYAKWNTYIGMPD